MFFLHFMCEVCMKKNLDSRLRHSCVCVCVSHLYACLSIIAKNDSPTVTHTQSVVHLISSCVTVYLPVLFRRIFIDSVCSGRYTTA